jgi:GWxTD domain-containing protein
MKHQITIVTSMAAAVAAVPTWTQTTPDIATPRVLVDAIILRGTMIGDPARCDIYVAVPYQMLQFRERDRSMLAEIVVTIVVRDENGTALFDTTYQRRIAEPSAAVARGTTGKSDNSVRRCTLRKGTFTIETTVSDRIGRRDYSTSRKVVIPAFHESAVELSTPMYVSQIEQRGNRYAITPFVGDVVWSHDLQLFVFLETYSSGQARSLRHRWVLTRNDGRTAASGTSDVVLCDRLATQSFFPLRLPTRLVPGTYTLNITAHPVTADGDIDSSITEATTSRQYIVPRTFTGEVLADLKKATKQLLYVADQDQIDAILNAPSEGESLALFEEYWQSMDPTPGTMRNEAFDEYYGRIDEANKRFKSYNEGWLTDMGRVFIVYGEPLTQERSLGPNGVSRVVRWTYGNGMIFVFEDFSGFGDFRLRSGMLGSGKYRYQSQ